MLSTNVCFYSLYCHCLTHYSHISRAPILPLSFGSSRRLLKSLFFHLLLEAGDFHVVSEGVFSLLRDPILFSLDKVASFEKVIRSATGCAGAMGLFLLFPPGAIFRGKFFENRRPCLFLLFFLLGALASRCWCGILCLWGLLSVKRGVSGKCRLD